jgi:Gpi18-like mannosyltransferase
VLSKIARLLKKDPQINQQRYPEVLFITAPIAIFAVFDFGQYDIIGVFFTLLGFYFYLKKDFLRFAIFFSIAISFKYFSLVIYIPLISS